MLGLGFNTTAEARIIEPPDIAREAEKEYIRQQYEHRPGHGGKGIGRGRQYGTSDAARGIRGMQSRKVIGRKKAFPVGGMTHSTAKRAAYFDMIRNAIETGAYL